MLMLKGPMVFLLLLFLLLQLSLPLVSSVAVKSSFQVIYDQTPKWRIQIIGLESVDIDSVSLGFKRMVMMKKDSDSDNGESDSESDSDIDKEFFRASDYSLSKDDNGEGITLKLLPGHRWASLSGQIPPIRIILQKVLVREEKDGKVTQTNLMSRDVVVGQLLNTPNVTESLQTVYCSVSNELKIQGTGFIGAKVLNFFFSPPLIKNVVYEDITPFPLKEDVVTLRLRQGNEWRSNRGPLKVIGVDTGGGPVKVNGEIGVVVAMVEDDLDFKGLTVEASKQLIFADEHQIVIRGAGFSPTRTSLRFANGLLGNGINYTVTAVTSTLISLQLVTGSYWKKNFDNLPGPLSLLAVNAGEGFVSVSPANSYTGLDVAIVFERPSITEDVSKTIYRTKTHQFEIVGSGFLTGKGEFVKAVQLRFKDLPSNAFMVRTISRYSIEVTLAHKKVWSSGTGPLIVTHVNTRGDEDGWVAVGMQVALILDDPGEPRVLSFNPKVYRSILQQPISLSIINLPSSTKDVSLELDSGLIQSKDFDVKRFGSNIVKLTLKSGKEWSNNAGLLSVTSITVDGKVYSMLNTDGTGICIATILDNPVVTHTELVYHETQSRLITIFGSGFTNADDTTVTLTPTLESTYTVHAVLEDKIMLLLNPGASWLPPSLSLNREEASATVSLQVRTINTGCGDIDLGDSVTIGLIQKDRLGLVCDDSCEFSINGVCDDESSPKYISHSTDKSAQLCRSGSDCTDCGGVDALIDHQDVPAFEVNCTNTCIYQRDGVCDDQRGTKYCALGTDCQDCGPAGASNFTRTDNQDWDDTEDVDDDPMDAFGDDLNLVVLTNDDDLQFSFDVNLGSNAKICSAHFSPALQKRGFFKQELHELYSDKTLSIITQFQTFTDNVPPGNLRFVFQDTRGRAAPQSYGGCFGCETGSIKRVGNWPNDYLSSNISGSKHTFTYTNTQIKLIGGFSQLCVENSCLNSCGRMRWLGKIKLQGYASKSGQSGFDNDESDGNGQRGGIWTGIMMGVVFSFLGLFLYHKYVASKLGAVGEVEMRERTLKPMAIVAGDAVSLQESLGLKGLSVSGVSDMMNVQMEDKVEREGLLSDENSEENNV